MTTKRTASERLAAARTAQRTIATQIEKATSRRTAFLIDDDDAGAAKADRELVELRLAAQRVSDKIALLGPAIEAERQQQDWPHELAPARAKLEQMGDRQRALSRKPRLDRSAADDAEIDELVSRIPAMRQHIRVLEKMQ
jgi:hypothetical protein